MSNYTTIRMSFADEDQFLDYLEPAIPELFQPAELDPDTNEVITPRTWIEQTIYVLRETLNVVRPSTGEVLYTIPGEAIGKRYARLAVHGAGCQRPSRDADGNVITETVTVDGEDTEVPVMETIPGFLVDLITNIAPETPEQQAAVDLFRVDPSHPIVRYGHELAAAS